MSRTPKLNDEKVLEIRHLYDVNGMHVRPTYMEIGKLFGVSKHTIFDIVRGRHAYKKFGDMKLTVQKKLTLDQMIELDAWYAQRSFKKKPPYKVMAHRYNTTERTICKAVRRKGSYANVPSTTVLKIMRTKRRNEPLRIAHDVFQSA